MRTTSVCEQSDSINHAVWNCPCWDWVANGTPAAERPNGMPKMKIIVKKVAKSNRELTGPIVTINLLMKEISHLLGFSMYSASTLSVVKTVCEVS
jgi:hypothetical protein